MRVSYVVLGLAGLSGCQYVWSIEEFPVPPKGGSYIGNPMGDFDGDQILNKDDKCPTQDNSLPGGRSDADNDGVPDLCDPHPTEPGDCLALFDDFGDGLSPNWVLYAGNPIHIVTDDPIIKQPFLQFENADDELIYLAPRLALDALWISTFAQAGDNGPPQGSPDPNKHAIQLYTDITLPTSGQPVGEACAIESQNGSGHMQHVHSDSGTDTIVASSPDVTDLTVGPGGTVTMMWNTKDAPGTCQGTTDTFPYDVGRVHAVADPVNGYGMKFALRGRHVGLYVFAIVGWGTSCTAM